MSLTLCYINSCSFFTRNSQQGICRALWGVNSDKRHGLETATREQRNGDKWLMSCQNSDNDTGTFRNSDIPSFEIQMEDIDNPPYRALFVLSQLANTYVIRRVAQLTHYGYRSLTAWGEWDLDGAGVIPLGGQVYKVRKKKRKWGSSSSQWAICYSMCLTLSLLSSKSTFSHHI